MGNLVDPIYNVQNQTTHHVFCSTSIAKTLLLPQQPNIAPLCTMACIPAAAG